MYSIIPTIGRRLAIATVLATNLAVLTPAVAGELQLKLQDGLVTLIARDVTAQEILAEWATVGQTMIVNLDQVNSGPVTLEFTDVPERMVLDVLLRSASGYLAAPRASVVRSASMYDRVIVMATSSPSAGGSARPPAPVAVDRPVTQAPAVAPGRPAFGFGGASGASPASSPFGTPAANTSPAFLGAAGTAQGGLEPDQQSAISLERPFPTPAAQPLTPLLPGDISTQGTPPSTANPWGVPAGSARTPGLVVQPPEPDSAGRTP